MELMTNKMTMTSKEIAELTGKRHDHVLVDIRKMLAEIGSPEKSGQYKDATGRTLPMLLLDKEESLCLVAGYNAKMRMAIIKRWQDLENKPALNLNDPNQLRTLLLDNVEKVIALEHQVKEQGAKIESLESLFTEGMTVVAFCKQLNGVNTQKINSFLHGKKWLCNEGNWRVASYARDKYLTESVAHEYEDSKGNKQIKYKQELLRKGAQRLHQMYIANELPMKKDWNGVYTHDKYAVKEVA